MTHIDWTIFSNVSGGQQLTSLARMTTPTTRVAETGDAPDDATTPYRIEPGDVFAGSVDPLGDVDWIEIPLAVGYDYIIELFATNVDPAGRNYSVRLYDNVQIFPRSGDTAAGGDPAQALHNLSFSSVGGPAGDYYLAVESTSGATFDYELHVKADIGQTAQTLGTIALDETVSETLDMLNDRDWYATTLESGYTYAFLANATGDIGPNQRVSLSLRDETGGQTVAGGATRINGPTVLDYTPAADGAFFIEVEDGTQGNAFDYFDTYDLTMIREVADDMSTRAMLTVGESYEGAYDYYGDTDWVGVDLVDGLTYRFGMFAQGTSGSQFARLFLRDPSGGVVTGTGNIVDLADGELVYTASATGKFYLQVVSSGSDILGGYRLSAEVVATPVTGTAGPDPLNGTAAPDAISGLDGNDTIYGGAGEDSLQGDGGDDLIGAGPDDDRLEGGAGNDGLYTAAGNDTALGGAGDDTLGGFTGDDVLGGGDGADQLWGAVGNDTMDGGAGNDTLGGAAGDDAADGGADEDEVWGGAGHDTLKGGADNDTLGGADGNDWLDGGDGADEIWGAAGSDTASGGEGDDRIGTGTGDDLANGGDGADEVSGGLGDDHVMGGTGNDTLFGAGGNDTVDGGEGDDSLFLGPGADVLVFSEGNDTVTFYNVAEDVIDLSDATGIADAGDLTANHLTEVSGNAVITDDAGHTLTFVGLSMADLSGASFDF